MSYSFQSFSFEQTLTSAQMNQVEANIRDHRHGRSNVAPAGITFSRTAKASGFNCVVGDAGELFDCSAAMTVTFDPAGTLGVGWAAMFYNRSAASNVTFDPSGAETISGELTTLLGPRASAIVWSDGSNLFISRFGGGAITHLQTQEIASPVATVDFTNIFSAQFDLYLFTAVALNSSSGSELHAIAGYGATPTWLTGSDWNSVLTARDSSTTTRVETNSTAQAGARLSPGYNVEAGGTNQTSAEVYVVGPNSSSREKTMVSRFQISAAQAAMVEGVHRNTLAASRTNPWTAFRWKLSANNIASGLFSAYGFAKA